MKIKIQCRKIYDDDSFGDWHRWSSKVYAKMENANHAIMNLAGNNRNWGFDLDTARMWKYEFRIVDKESDITIVLKTQTPQP